MKLRKWLYNWLTKDEREDASKPAPSGMLAGYANATMAKEEIGTTKVRFSVQRAKGGYVVEAYHYDMRTDRNNTEVYVFSEESDVGSEIGKIVTMEAMRL